MFLLVVMVIAGTGWFASQLDSRVVKVEHGLQDQAVLQRAKRALMARAITESKHPGRLRCPDVDDDGSSELANPCRLALGRFPWKTLDLNDVRDSAGERLWYVVSPKFLVGAKPINSDTQTSLQLDGKDGIAALLLAPGLALGNQTGRVPGKVGVAEYLDGQNAAGGYNYVSMGGEKFNDRVVAITRDELMSAVERRIAGEIKTLLRDYAAACGGEFPVPAPFENPVTAGYKSDSFVPPLYEGLLPVNGAAPADWGQPCTVAITPNLPAWLKGHDWHRLIYYALAPGGTACISGTNCLTVAGARTVNDNIKALVIVAGPDLNGNRPSPLLADYLERDNATPGDASFYYGDRLATYNDRLVVVAP